MKKYQKPSLQIVSLTSENEIAAGGFWGSGAGDVSVGAVTGVTPTIGIVVSSFGGGS